MDIVQVPSLKKLIQPSSWKTKKLLADAHLDVLKLCQYGCRYCSSNSGAHIRWKTKEINERVKKSTGREFDRRDVSSLTLTYEDAVGQLEQELSKVRKAKGAGQVLVYSQLTDGFSPVLVQQDIPRRALDLVLERTSYRIRILTKNAIVGRSDWVEYFQRHRDRFVVGLSIGTLDDSFSKKMELLTSLPTQRIKALHALQDAEVPTYGMLCPIFPQVVLNGELEDLIAAIRPKFCEDVWAEPFNDRNNWQHTQSAYEQDSKIWEWMTEVYENKCTDVWSEYATELYLRLARHGKQYGWLSKLKYMLYEELISSIDASKFGDRVGLLLQRTNKNGLSDNPAFNIDYRFHKVGSHADAPNSQASAIATGK